MPGNICYVPLDGGEQVSFSVGNPAAGANWLYTIPAGYEYEIRCMQCKLTTAAVAGNRQPLFVIYDAGANDHWRLYFTTPTIISEISVFSLYVGCRRSDFTLLVSVGNRHNNDALPFNRLPAGFQFGTAFSALNGSDQFSEIRILAHRWKA